MKAADFSDDMLQSYSGGLPSPERTGEPHPMGGGAVPSGIDGDGASPGPSLVWDRQSSLSSSLSSFSEVEIELEYRVRRPQSELEEIPSWRWLSPSLMPQQPATQRPESEEVERTLSFDPLRPAGNERVEKIVIKVTMAHERTRMKAMKVATSIDGVITVAIPDKDQLVVVGSGIDVVELTLRLRKRMGFTFSLTVKGLFNWLHGPVKLVSVAALYPSLVQE